MKYIHIVQYHLMSGGGVGSVITDLCNSMSNETKEVYIISLFRHEGIDFDIEKKWAKELGIKVFLMQNTHNTNLLTIFKKLREKLKELCKNDECCLYMHLKWGVLAGIVSSLGLKNIKRVEVYHSGYMKYKIQSFLCKPFINKYISVSKEAKLQLERWFSVNKQKIQVVYNGVDIEYIRHLSRNSVKFNSDIVFMSVGRLSFEKGFLTSIEAYSDLCADCKVHNSNYIMIGGGSQYNDAYKISKGYVNFKGIIPRDSVYCNIAGSDVMVLPSLWEGNSILLLEVLCIGKALIVSDIPSFREVLGFSPLENNEIIRNEAFGVVFRANNVDSCKKAILSIIDRKEQFDNMAKYVRKHADAFSIDNQVRLYMNVANELFKNDKQNLQY